MQTQRYHIIKAAAVMLASAILAGSLGGCVASKEARTHPDDPLEPTNRGIHKVNDTLDTIILEPIAKGYRKLPDPAQTALTNFAEWTGYPAIAVISLLNRDAGNSGKAVAHFLLNGVTLGFADLTPGDDPEGIGLNDVVADAGVPQGPYTVLPLLGPATLRGRIAGFVGGYFDPLGYLRKDSAIQQASLPVGIITFRGNNLEFINDIKYNSPDPYSRTRTFVLQVEPGAGGSGLTEEEQDAVYDDFFNDEEETQ